MLIVRIMNLSHMRPAPTTAWSAQGAAMPAVSFEFFPPKSLEGSFRLWDCCNVLGPLGPEFVSVTYGAGGTTRTLTHDAVETIHKHYDLNVAAHLTCVDASREETLAIAGSY